LDWTAWTDSQDGPLRKIFSHLCKVSNTLNNEEELIDVDMSTLDPNLFDVPDDFSISSVPSQQSSFRTPAASSSK
jgi:hypothetical protein